MTSQLYIRIDATTKRGKLVTTYYVLHRLPDAEAVKVAWELVAEESKHTVTMYENGVLDCDCEDFGYRRQHNNELCKHLDSAIEQGLFK